MEQKKSKNNVSRSLHEIRSENAKKEKRDSRGRFIASSQKNVSTPKNQKRSSQEGDIDIIIIDEEFGCGC